jgi:hypothetical protein
LQQLYGFAALRCFATGFGAGSSQFRTGFPYSLQLLATGFTGFATLLLATTFAGAFFLQ